MKNYVLKVGGQFYTEKRTVCWTTNSDMATFYDQETAEKIAAYWIRMKSILSGMRCDPVEVLQVKTESA